jgi:hypothetical protein
MRCPPGGARVFIHSLDVCIILVKNPGSILQLDIINIPFVVLVHPRLKLRANSNPPHMLVVGGETWLRQNRNQN